MVSIREMYCFALRLRQAEQWPQEQFTYSEMYLLNTDRGERHLKGLSSNIIGGIENFQSVNHYLLLQCEFHKWQVDRLKQKTYG